MFAIEVTVGLGPFLQHARAFSRSTDLSNRDWNGHAFHKIAKDRKVIPDPIDDRKFQE